MAATGSTEFQFCPAVGSGHVHASLKESNRSSLLISFWISARKTGELIPNTCIDRMVICCGLGSAASRPEAVP